MLERVRELIGLDKTEYPLKRYRSGSEEKFSMGTVRLISATTNSRDALLPTKIKEMMKLAFDRERTYMYSSLSQTVGVHVTKEGYNDSCLQKDN